MVVFNYQSPMDKGYYAGDSAPTPKLEEPIYPVRELGTTFVDKLPGGQGNVLSMADASIKLGVGTLQLVMTTPHNSPIGGGVKAIGKDIKQALKEKMLANNILLTGVEMPTSSMTNMSGYDPRERVFSDQEAQDSKQEIKNAIQFVGEVMQGGGIDIWSQEFPRDIFSQKWNERKVNEYGEKIFQFTAFEGEPKKGMKYIIDSSRGQVQGISYDQDLTFTEWKKAENDYIDKKGNTIKAGEYIDEDNVKIARITDRVPKRKTDGTVSTFRGKLSEQKIYDDLARDARIRTELIKADKQKKGEIFSEIDTVTPELEFFYSSLDGQIRTSEGYAKLYASEANDAKAQFDQNKAESDQQFEEIKKNGIPLDQNKPELGRRPASTEELGLIKEGISKRLQPIKERYESRLELSQGQSLQAEQQKIQKDRLKAIEPYGKDRSFTNYAELGIAAMQETNMRKDIKKPIHVGPEMGWPQAYGGHPDEFIELINGARGKMVDLLTKPVLNGKPNPYFDRAMNERTARDRAEKHIKGVFDTSHMGMWLQHFRRDPKEDDATRLKEFEKWYLVQVDKLAKSGTVGGIQVVDTATGGHAHLPPGQGILPLKETLRKFKENNYDGFIVSEGHEEEQFGQGRILYKTWEMMGAPLSKYATGRGYGSLPSYRWNDVAGHYFGRTYVPGFIVGAYSPSNEWKLWSEVPFE